MALSAQCPVTLRNTGCLAQHQEMRFSHRPREPGISEEVGAMDRREFIQFSGAALAAAVAGFRTVLASAPTENRLVFIILGAG